MRIAACASDVPQAIKFSYGTATEDHQATTAKEAVPPMQRPLHAKAALPQQAVVQQPTKSQDVRVAERSEQAASAVESAAAAADASSKPGKGGMSIAAWAYVCGVLMAGLGLFIVSLVQFPATSFPWLPFGVLVALASLAQLYRAEGPHCTLFHATPIFYFAGVLMLPPQLFVLLVVIPLVAEWARERWNGSTNLRAWYLQPFNLAMYTIAGIASYTVLQTLHGGIGGLSSSSLPVIATVALTYVTVSQVILGLALRLARGISWRESGVLTEGLLTDFVLACLGYVMTVHWHISPWLIMLALTPLVLIYRSLTVPKLQAENMQALHRMNQQLSQANQAIHELNDELFLTLAKIFDARDPYVGGHAAQVAHYAVAIAGELGFSDEQLQLVRQAGYLHDIGKMAIPESILHKPSKLTNEEFDLVKRHASLGAEFLETSQGLRHLAPFVRHHHERWDGRGYPDCLQGEEIPIEARILNVCDSVEAMAADRPYHRGMSLDEIIAEIKRCSGSQFDPTIAEVFIRIAEREGDEFVVNSARVVEQRTVRISPLSLMNTVLFSPVYQPAD